ncbi:MAG: hypothetical protein QOK28_2857 [Actinomycetota bacterium]|jgi:hypothetical protein
MFEGLSPEVDALLNAAKADLPTAQADAGLLEAMTLALSVDALAPTQTPASRRRPMLGKVLTAKAAAIAGVLVLTGGVASAATGTLPDPAQNAASHAVEHVGLHIPKSDDNDAADTDTDTKDANEENGNETTTTVEHPDNHGKDVSTVAHDKSTTGEDHGTAVCTVASEGKCKAGADEKTDDHSGQGGNSADHRQDGDHEHEDEQTTSTTTVTPTTQHEDGGGHHGGDDSGSHSSDD